MNPIAFRGLKSCSRTKIYNIRNTRDVYVHTHMYEYTATSLTLRGWKQPRASVQSAWPPWSPQKRVWPLQFVRYQVETWPRGGIAASSCLGASVDLRSPFQLGSLWWRSQNLDLDWPTYTCMYIMCMWLSYKKRRRIDLLHFRVYVEWQTLIPWLSYCY